jgi:hypothetical protein
MAKSVLPKYIFVMTQMLLNICLTSTTIMLLALPTWPLTILFLCVNHITYTAR